MEAPSIESRLPEKYEELCESFDTLATLIRSLGLKNLPSNFNKLCPIFKKFTNRTLTLELIAKMKFILPEMILLEVIFQNEGRTLMPETSSIPLHLRKEFRGQLMEFFKLHPTAPEGRTTLMK